MQDTLDARRLPFRRSTIDLHDGVLVIRRLRMAGILHAKAVVMQLHAPPWRPNSTKLASRQTELWG